MVQRYKAGIPCIDRTFQKTETNHYLTSLVVLDERKDGIQVAFSIYPKHDTDTFTAFFKKVLKDVGRIKCQHFISNGEGTFYNALSYVMGESLNRRLCIWHVKKNWGEKLVTLGFRGQEYDTAKKTLSNILEAPS